MDVVPKSRRMVRYEGGDQEERPWVNWRVVDVAASFITRQVEVKPRPRLSPRFHKHRPEHWVIVAGMGEPTVGDSKVGVTLCAHVVIPCGALHHTHNTSDEMLAFVEVQCGKLLDESGITRLDDDYGQG
jgi:mannose-6-phosphate isomerase-like protein (cupin superfamily)